MPVEGMLDALGVVLLNVLADQRIAPGAGQDCRRDFGKTALKADGNHVVGVGLVVHAHGRLVDHLPGDAQLSQIALMDRILGVQRRCDETAEDAHVRLLDGTDETQCEYFGVLHQVLVVLDHIILELGDRKCAVRDSFYKRVRIIALPDRDSFVVKSL